MNSNGNEMHKILFIYYILVSAFLGCSPNKPIHKSQNGSDPLSRQVNQMDKKFRLNFPGSEVQAHYDEYGKAFVVVRINVLTPVCHCSPLNSKSFYNLPTIWSNRNPYLDRLSAEIAEYLLHRINVTAVNHIIVSLEKDKEGKSYTSIYRISREQRFDNGPFSHINLQQSSRDDFVLLNLENTVISKNL